jgi:SNF2 family DNA or RNA helicase
MIVHQDSNSLLLKLRQPELVKKVIPHWSKEISYEGHNIAVKFDLEVVKVLRNMGVKAPSPIRFNYHWPRPAKFKKVFDHQVATAEFATLHHRLFILNEMGTSKTASALWAADYLMTQGYVGKVLVVSPLSTLELVWADEIFQCLMHRSCVALHGSREKRFDLLNTDANFYIINHDGLKIIADELKKRKDINLIVVDEAAAYRNATTNRYKVLANLLQPWHRLWLLTGTPCPNSPLDAWALTRLVNPGNVPQYFGQWKRQTMMQLSQYKWVPRPGAHESAFQAMQPAVRFKKSECLDLPPVTYENRQAPITAEQVGYLKEMKREAAVELANGVQITAANAADKIGKMRQILCGAIKDAATDTYHPIDHKPRLNLLLECIEQAAAKVLVIVPFKGILYQLKDEIEAAWKADGHNWACDFVNGDVSSKARADKFRWFKSVPEAKLLLCHPKVMAHGITATEADMLIFYAPIYSNEESQQVMERINRPGQTRKMTIIRIGASNVEWNIYDQVEGKRLSQESILEMYKRELLSL